VPQSLHVYHKEETVNFGATDWSGLFGAGASAVNVEAVSRWQGETLVTRWTLPATGARRLQSYTETRWLDKTGAMIVELRSSGGEIVRRTVYRKGS